MAEVVLFTGITTLKVDPDQILEHAMGKVDDVVVVGWTPEGEFFFAASESGAAENILLLERAKYRLMQMMDELESRNDND